MTKLADLQAAAREAIDASVGTFARLADVTYRKTAPHTWRAVGRDGRPQWNRPFLCDLDMAGAVVLRWWLVTESTSHGAREHAVAAFDETQALRLTFAQLQREADGDWQGSTLGARLMHVFDITDARLRGSDVLGPSYVRLLP